MRSDEDSGRRLEQISTSWTGLHDPIRFVMTYGPAVRRYLRALLSDEHEVDEALQDLLVQVTEKGFTRVDPERGRFRDYLKAVVRNAARARLRRRPPDRAGGAELAQLPDASASAEAAWLAEWQRCVLNKAWRGLERHQRAAPGNLFFTVLRLAGEHTDEDSRQLAERAAIEAGQPLSAEAFRKQLSRARRKFAELIAAEVAQTLHEPTSEEVRAELAAVGLLESLRPYLPDAD